MLFLPHMKSHIAKFRGLAAALALFLLLLTGVAASWLVAQQQQHALALHAARQGVMQVEKMLNNAQQASVQAAPLIGQPCQAILPTLRTVATRAEFVRTLNLVQQDAIYCSSLSGDVAEPVRRDDFTTGKLAMLAGNALRPGHPILSLWTPAPNGAVLTNIDSTHLGNAISSHLPSGHIGLRVGKVWLDETGSISRTQPATLSDSVIHRSAKYPIAVVASYATNMTGWLDWARDWWPISLLWLLLSLYAAFSLWRWPGRVPPLEAELREGLKRGEFMPYVQPVLSAHNRQLCGLEVLMRWQRRDIGLVEPMQFIPQAEASGLIVPMTRQMMEHVVAQLAPMASRLPTPFHVAVNISAAHFLSNTLPSDCREFLSHFPAGKVQLTLELTEREWLSNNTQTLTLFHELRRMGIYLALDDFGTGHSSLAYLKQFPVDIIKLDQMFVRKIGVEEVSQHVVNHVIDLGHKLGLEIVAEGVETEFQADYLIRQGVDQLQGYLFGRPRPLQEWLTGLACAA